MITPRGLKFAFFLLCISSFIAGIVFPVEGRAQTEGYTIDEIRQSTVDQFHRVEDFAVKVRVDMDMPGLRMPRKMVEFLYKQPDKFKVESASFAIVPKSGLVLSPERIYENVSDLRKIHPDSSGIWLEGKVTSDSGAFQMGEAPPGTLRDKLRLRFRVDPDRWVITNIETVADTLTFLRIESSYEEVEQGIWLPSKTTMSFTVPEGMTANRQHPGMDPEELEESLEEMEKGDAKRVSGSVVIEFLNYKVNTGLSDKLFEKETFN